MSKIEKIKALLGMESNINLAMEATLTDGTIVGTDAEEWVAGVLAYVVSDDGSKMPLPTGEFELEDGRILVIEDGTVTEIREPEEVEVEEEEVVEVEAQKVSKADLIKVIEQMSKDFDSKIETLSKEINANMKKFSATKPLISRKNTQVQKVEIAKPLTEMSVSERANSIFNKYNN
jgi:hypothetical protein|tara:strand:- start:1209 stop:1736 length:528 start_codon:yes stop_codon:yes gene_type:complete